MSRYIVRSVGGFQTMGRRGSKRKPGLSAMVLDTLVLHRVVYLRRSEDQWHVGPPNGRIAMHGNYTADGALSDARRVAAKLNAEHEAWEAS